MPSMRLMSAIWERGPASPICPSLPLSNRSRQSWLPNIPLPSVDNETCRFQGLWCRALLRPALRFDSRYDLLPVGKEQVRPQHHAAPGAPADQEAAATRLPEVAAQGLAPPEGKRQRQEARFLLSGSRTLGGQRRVRCRADRLRPLAAHAGFAEGQGPPVQACVLDSLHHPLRRYVRPAFAGHSPGSLPA